MLLNYGLCLPHYCGIIISSALAISLLALAEVRRCWSGVVAATRSCTQRCPRVRVAAGVRRAAPGASPVMKSRLMWLAAPAALRSARRAVAVTAAVSSAILGLGHASAATQPTRSKWRPWSAISESRARMKETQKVKPKRCQQPISELAPDNFFNPAT